MFYAFLFLLFAALTGLALFFFIWSSELRTQMRQAEEAWRDNEKEFTSELARLESIRHIPDIIEKVRRSKEQVEAKLAEAQKRADSIVQLAAAEAQSQSRRILNAAETQLSEAKSERQRLLADAEEALRSA